MYCGNITKKVLQFCIMSALPTWLKIILNPILYHVGFVDMAKNNIKSHFTGKPRYSTKRPLSKIANAIFLDPILYETTLSTAGWRRQADVLRRWVKQCFEIISLVEGIYPQYPPNKN